MPNPNRPSSKPSDEWYTPPQFVHSIAAHLQLTITLDPAATPESAKAPRFFTFEDDGLSKDWAAAAGTGAVWLNPPYSSPARWVAKAAETAAAGTTVVALLRASIDTHWFNDHVMGHASELITLHGRLRYLRPGGKSPGPANHASILVVWRPGHPEGQPPRLRSLSVADLCRTPETKLMAA